MAPRARRRRCGVNARRPGAPPLPTGLLCCCCGSRWTSTPPRGGQIVVRAQPDVEGHLAKRGSGGLGGLGYAAGWRVVRTLPRPLVAPLFTAAADLAVLHGATGVRRLAANLRRVVGPAVPPA